MGRAPKFRKGDKVKSILNKFEIYEVIEVLRNRLIVIPTEQRDLRYTCDKRIFEKIENE